MTQLVICWRAVFSEKLRNKIMRMRTHCHLMSQMCVIYVTRVHDQSLMAIITARPCCNVANN